MNKSSIWTVIGVIVSVVVAWWIVSALFSLLWLIGKLVIVAVVALIVFFVLRNVFARSDSE